MSRGAHPVDEINTLQHRIVCRNTVIARLCRAISVCADNSGADFCCDLEEEFWDGLTYLAEHTIEDAQAIEKLSEAWVKAESEER